MTTHAFRLLNVFAESTFGGNPLCVFEDGRGLDDATMQALARQFNLSETTFLLPSERAAARVRVFTPDYELPFAGHPTLGSAHVVRDRSEAGDAFMLEFAAGPVPVSASGDVWTLTAPAGGHPGIAACVKPGAALTGVFGLGAGDLAAVPTWVDTGVRQLLLPLATPEAVRRARPDASRLEDWPGNGVMRRSAYLFAFDPARPGKVVSRYFFEMQGSVIEDPGTGSACANLGGWLLSRDAPLPLAYAIEQGDAVGRPCRLSLNVTPERTVRVGGRVIEIARGVVTLQDSPHSTK
ncbi:PhzF family phenazine biosynthesis protein [Robbsia sp. Bb-Pol-6]|uniref:PhzF family phenazine biosynthesis protein n=1 Tax=Robbsia betulipollinis TaxID=2981849 RepID=A0ABT3ZJF4_9BURK|nr:PhzF family phenazine biosynthesis protein [Robbsia betulipollinis]MCY0386646.1 PhzF family phenazine biosynthesis protein [Robbsia betulipollinis]